jgi:hypothetical protein
MNLLPRPLEIIVVRETSLSWDVVEAAAGRLKRAGLLEVLVDDERGYESWRVSETALAAAAAGPTVCARGRAVPDLGTVQVPDEFDDLGVLVVDDSA